MTHRFYLSKADINKQGLILSGSEWRHCQVVLRAKKGDKVTVFDGEGTEYLTEIRDASSKQAQLQLIQKSTSSRPSYSISLVQALPKNKVMDYIIQKATELGVVEIIPVMSERSTVKVDTEDASSKLERWKEITIEAAKQCGLNWLPTIRPPMTVKAATDLRSNYKMGFIASLQPEAKSLWHYLTDSKTAEGNALVMIGPEGDFTPAEISLARSSGFQPITLGPLILRCDTAAIYVLSTLSYEMRRYQQR
jgi:16S rRNA (uracil1498-N3)-methyltransferase